MRCWLSNTDAKSRAKILPTDSENADLVNVAITAGPARTAVSSSSCGAMLLFIVSCWLLLLLDDANPIEQWKATFIQISTSTMMTSRSHCLPCLRPTKVSCAYTCSTITPPMPTRIELFARSKIEDDLSMSFADMTVTRVRDMTAA